MDKINPCFCRFGIGGLLFFQSINNCLCQISRIDKFVCDPKICNSFAGFILNVFGHNEEDWNFVNFDRRQNVGQAELRCDGYELMKISNDQCNVILGGDQRNIFSMIVENIRQGESFIAIEKQLGQYFWICPLHIAYDFHFYLLSSSDYRSAEQVV